MWKGDYDYVVIGLQERETVTKLALADYTLLTSN